MICASATSRGDLPDGLRNVHILTVVSCAWASGGAASPKTAPASAIDSNDLRNMVFLL